MASATSAPPLIAPGIKCPKCGGNMLDERRAKRTDKSPDYTCANLTCVETKNGKTYRTAIWAKDAGGNGALPIQAAPASTGGSSSSVGVPAGAEPQGEERDKALLAQRSIYAVRMRQAVKYVLEEIEPLYKAKGIGMSDDGVYKHAYSIWQEWSHRGIIS